MIVSKVIYGNTVEDELQHDYAFILDEAATALSESELKHLTDIANIGYQYASPKYEYIETLHDRVFDWLAEDRRKKFHFSHASAVIDFESWYNDSEEVKSQMDSAKSIHAIPTFFVFFGAIVLALFCISATILVMGLCQNAFPINPVYLFMFAVGFLGLLLTDIVAIAEWRKGQNEQKQRNN